jgi:hypothetical protein
MNLYKYIFPIFISLCVSYKATYADEISSYAPYVKTENTLFYLPFRVEAKAKNGIFRSPIWGLKIESVLCDGNPVLAKKVAVQFSDLDFRTFTPKSNIASYVITPNFFSALSFNVNSGAYDVVEYKFPKVFSEVIVKYRIRYPDLTTSDLCESRSVDYDSFGFDEK